MEFLHQLAARPVTCNDEAFHGLLLFLDGQDPGADYPARLASLRTRNLLPGQFNQGPDHAVERGTVAVALVRALSIKGGLTMHLLGPTPRYAVRELQYLGLFPPSSPNQTFNGGEFLAVLSKAEEYQQGHGLPSRGTPPAESVKE